MKKSRILAFVMSVFMMISMLPAAVFAEAPASTLEGELKIKGKAAAEVTLKADYTKVKPEGVTDDDVSFLWQRKISDSADDPMVDLSKEKTYKVTAEDVGYKIVLTITGREDKGYTGTLTVTSGEVAAEEPQEQSGEEIPEVQEEYYEELPEEQSEEVIPEVQEEYYEELPEEQSGEEIPEVQEEYYEELPEEQSEELFPENQVEEQVYNSTQDDSEELTPVNEPGESEEIYYGDEELTPVEETGMEEPLMEENISYNVEAVTEDGSNVLDFGTIQAGTESDVELKYVTVRNTGTGPLNFEDISPENFMVQDISGTLEAGEEVTLWIRPRDGREAGEYDDTITYTSDQLAEASFKAKVTVEEAAETEELTNSETPAENEESPADAENSEGTVPDNTEVTDPEETPDGETPADSETPSEPDDSEKPDDSEEPDDPAEPTEPETPVDPVREITPSTVSLNFGKATEGYEELPEAQTVELTNTGDVEVTIDELICEDGNFSTGEFAPVTLQPKEKCEITIQPLSGLKTGTHEDVIHVYSDQENADGEAEILASITAVFEVEKKIEHKLTVISTELEFASVTEGYTDAPEAKKVEVMNDGTETEVLYQPEGKEFEIGNLSRTELKPKEKCEFTIRPVKGLKAGEHSETIYIPNESNQEISVTASITVNKKEDTSVKLTAIQKPTEITGLANGTEKKASALKLPATVVIETTKGKKKAKVAWDVKGCAYDPKSTNAQSFNVKGKVTLPEGVKNPDELSLVTSVKVSVNGYTANVASADDNQITGITPNGQYTTKSTITFTAVGAGMKNESPRKGDVRYLPLNWTVVNTNTWTSAPYAASFGMGRSGNYTLSVVFARQEYDGSKWVNKGEQDTKKVSFSVVKAAEQTVTPTPGANQKKAVKTGDDTPIIPFVIALVIAVVLIAGVVVYRKKK